MANNRFKVDHGIVASGNSEFHQKVDVFANLFVNADSTMFTGNLTVTGSLNFANINVNGDLLTNVDRVDFGNSTFRFDVFSYDTTVYNGVLPSANGKFLGSINQRFDIFGANADLSGTLKFGNSTVNSSISGAFYTGIANNANTVYGISDVGYIVRSGNNAGAAREFLAANGLTVTNGTGVVGNTTYSLTLGGGLFSNTTGLFVNASAISVGVTPLSRGGTNASTQQGAINNLLPSQTGLGGYFLTTDGVNVTWVNAVGPIGPTGFTGSQGATGAQGPIGYTGSQGIQGALGYTGSAGTNGTNGSTGAQGPIGYTGSSGTNGTNGFTGSQGSQGIQGIQGIQGPIGYTGSAGTNGTNGSQGPIGYTGSQGSTGAQGNIGYTGSAGTNGSNGATGAQGPIGYTGSQGPQGNLGYTGSAGTNGTNGSQGPIGYTGSQGTAGSTGAVGYTGSAGTAGSSGATGYTGSLGYTGSGYGTTASVQMGSLGVGTPASGTTGEIRATNNITSYYSSDRKFKENIEDIPQALDKVLAIGGKLFDWTEEYIDAHGGIDGYFIRKQDFGVIAQDVESVFPLGIRTREDGTLAVDYEKLCALSFQAIKELYEELQDLKQMRLM